MSLARLLRFPQRPAAPGATSPRTTDATTPVRVTQGSKGPKVDRARTLDVIERCYGLPVAPAAVRIRRAVLLHRSGRKADAWAMFDLLLADHELGGSATLRPILHSEIYARMGTCLEREGCFHAALTPTVLSYATRAQFFSIQERRSELKYLLSPGVFDRFISPLLARARLEHVLVSVRGILRHHLERLPQLNVDELRGSVDYICRNG